MSLNTSDHAMMYELWQALKSLVCVSTQDKYP